MEPLPATHLYVISGLVSPCYWRGFEARVHHNLDCCLNHPCGLIYVIDRGRGHLCLYFCRDTGPWGLLSCRADVSVKALSHTHQNEAWRLGDEFRRGSKGEARLGSRGGGRWGVTSCDHSFGDCVSALYALTASACLSTFSSKHCCLSCSTNT